VPDLSEPDLTTQTDLAPGSGKSLAPVVTMWKSLKRWPPLLVLLVTVGALAVGLAWLPYRNRVTPENCARIKEGMTKTEVYAILGEPWNNELFDADPPSAREIDRLSVLWQERQVKEGGYSCFWMSSSIGILVVFDSDGRVLFTEPCTDPDRPRSWLPARVWERLRPHLRW
jgi:hypothetical protein